MSQENKEEIQGLNIKAKEIIKLSNKFFSSITIQTTEMPTSHGNPVPRWGGGNMPRSSNSIKSYSWGKFSTEMSEMQLDLLEKYDSWYERSRHIISTSLNDRLQSFDKSYQKLREYISLDNPPDSQDNITFSHKFQKDFSIQKSILLSISSVVEDNKNEQNPIINTSTSSRFSEILDNSLTQVFAKLIYAAILAGLYLLYLKFDILIVIEIFLLIIIVVIYRHHNFAKIRKPIFLLLILILILFTYSIFQIVHPNPTPPFTIPELEIRLVNNGSNDTYVSNRGEFFLTIPETPSTDKLISTGRIELIQHDGDNNLELTDLLIPAQGELIVYAHILNPLEYRTFLEMESTDMLLTIYQKDKKMLSQQGIHFDRITLANSYIVLKTKPTI